VDIILSLKEKAYYGHSSPQVKKETIPVLYLPFTETPPRRPALNDMNMMAIITHSQVEESIYWIKE